MGDTTELKLCEDHRHRNQILPRSGGGVTGVSPREETAADRGANEPRPGPDIDSQFARLPDYPPGPAQPQGELVCTLRVPQNIVAAAEEESSWGGGEGGGGDSVLTPDSDRDSGCFSEETPATCGAAAGSKQAPEPCGTQTSGPDGGNNGDTAAAGKLRRGKWVANFPRPSYRTQPQPRPFQRKIWKRRNGWFRVRNPGVLGAAGGGHRDWEGGEAVAGLAGVRSQLSESGQDTQRSRSRHPAPPRPRHDKLTFLREREAAKECEAVREIQKITFEQELSDNDQGLDIFSDTSDTIKANGDGGSESPSLDVRSAPGGSSVSDLQLQLSKMRMEIAQMVAEAERLDNSESEEDSWHLETVSAIQTSLSLTSDSDGSEISEEIYCSDEWEDT